MTPLSGSIDNIIRTPDLDYTPDPKGLGYVLHQRMKSFGDKIAQIDGITGKKDTYDFLLQRCIRMAIKMRSLGVTHEDIICTCCLNHFDSCVPYIAALFLGTKVCALDPSLGEQDIVHLLQQVTPKIIFVDSDAEELIHKTINKIQKDVKVIVVLNVLQPNAEEHCFQPYETNDVFDTAIIFFSSGTTGLPKGICIHHYGMLSQIHNYFNSGCCSDAYLTFTSLYWVTSAFVVLATILRGNARILIPKFNPELVWNAITKFKPTSLNLVPFHCVIMCRNKPKNADTSSVTHLGVGGSVLVQSQMLDIQEAFPTSQLFPAYGQTEMSFAVTFFNVNSERDREFIKSKPTSSGTVVPGIWYKVVDVDTEEILGPNEPGELRVKTKFCMKGYYNMDSSCAFDSDGWLKTGDLVYYDEDKCFYVLDRLKDFFKFQSWHVPPAFVENILMQHPEIATALVIGLPNDVDGNHLMALVVLKNAKSKVTPKEIEEFVEKRVDDRKRLRGGVRIVAHIPLSATGKAKRREIRDSVLRGEL
ncbi:hypothetical protein RN001_015564 [Aquatica leii]|uniref:Uncharacterized protein n=1 Tax=Aquatica leii TaxID=1421715 RepID=A0AAN7NVS6_9COLE|nr:hypothetical protein RN001_015564 [Aquatica leii]